MRLVFAGTPEPALPSLEALLKSDHEVVAVVTRPDARTGRGRTLTPSPVAQRARDADIEVLTPMRPRDEDFVARLTDLAPDACPIVAYGGLIPPHVLGIPTHGWINLHFSLLPAWRGAAPVQHAIIAGDDIVGASTFALEEGLDTGPVYGTLTEGVGPHDTAGELLDRLADAGAELLVRTLDGIGAGRLKARAQSTQGVSHAPKLTVEDARVDWGATAVVVDRRIRGCTPAPGAWSSLRDQRIKLGPVTPDVSADPLEPGRIRAGRREVHVGTASVPVRLGTVQAPGKRAVPAADWARGLHLGDDEGFTS